MNFSRLFSISTTLALFSLSACNGQSGSGTSASAANDNLDGSDSSASTAPQANSSGTTPVPGAPVVSPIPNSSPSPSAPPKVVRTYKVDALLFAGDGTWGVEVSSLESILKSHNSTYKKVTSAQLDALSLDELAQFGVLIFPGGSGGSQADSLSSATHARLRAAVQERGVSYIGFCAGAFIAVAPAPAPGRDVSYGLGIVPGEVLEYYYLEYQINPDIAMTLATFADGSTHDLLWYGGPVTPNTPGGVIAKYPNGDPAISQTFSGKGFVIISGPHPAAPQSVRNSYGLDDSDGTDFELTWKLISSAMRQQPLQAF